MATSLHKLLRNRRQVRWDWVAPLAALVILVELFNLWWSWRNFTGNSLADVAPYFLVMVLLFLTASAALPDEVPEEGIDLGRYFDENRGYFLSLYGTYIAVWIGSWTVADIRKRPSPTCWATITSIIRGSLPASSWYSSGSAGSAAGSSSSPWPGSFTATAGGASRSLAPELPAKRKGASRSGRRPSFPALD